jgi:hypothetical protein
MEVSNVPGKDIHPFHTEPPNRNNNHKQYMHNSRQDDGPWLVRFALLLSFREGKLVFGLRKVDHVTQKGRQPLSVITIRGGKGHAWLVLFIASTTAQTSPCSAVCSV